MTRDVELGNKHLDGSFGPEDCDVTFRPVSERCILVEWGVNHVGFGQLYLDLSIDGHIKSLSAETMQKPFIKALLCAAIDKAELRD